MEKLAQYLLTTCSETEARFMLDGMTAKELKELAKELAVMTRGKNKKEIVDKIVQVAITNRIAMKHLRERA